MKFWVFGRWVTVGRVCLTAVLALGLLVPHAGWAQKRKLFDENSGICPQPRKTVTAPSEFLKLENPLEATPQNVLAGKTLFHVDAEPSPCRVCHGISGNGLGILFHRVEPKPRNFTCIHTMENLPDGQLFWVIKNGSPGTAMPSFSYLEDDQVWQLILYLRSFSEKE